ncbi:universal stress protein [Paracidobacterium acidisoli]|uniref:Universal stress protein n=1 Tax=Paracidobacterium acidisoli TaxID=2303751 RepID=A0A372IJ70_9BACT|nr:universal stress protein [Paracidobacterium acidisoli]MBT9333380.1 universal stress protein [Paracidobacterium acidisoli]
MKSHSLFARILMATDLSAASQVAYRVARDLAVLLNAHLLLLHVFEYAGAASPMTGGIAEGLSAFRQSAEHELELLLLDSAKHGLTVEGRITDGIVSEVILETAGQQRIDLVVMGTRRTTGLERFLLGSTAEVVFRSSDCPVLTAGPRVLTPTGPPHTRGPIVFATDLSHMSTAAVRSAAFLCERTGVPLHCLHVLPRCDLKPGDEDALRRTSAAAIGQMIHEGGFAIGDPLCAIACDDDASTGVLDYAAQHKASLIVLGVRHASPVAAHLPGKIACQIIAGAACPVLVATDQLRSRC